MALTRACPARCRVWQASACQLVWGSQSPRALLGLEQAPDLILAADVVYGNDPVAWQALVHSLAELGDARTLFLLANMQRYPLHHPLSEVTFLDNALAAQFQFVQLPQSALHPDYQRAGAGSCAVYAFRRRPGAAQPSLDLQAPHTAPRALPPQGDATAGSAKGKKKRKAKRKEAEEEEEEDGDHAAQEPAVVEAVSATPTEGVATTSGSGSRQRLGSVVAQGSSKRRRLGRRIAGLGSPLRGSAGKLRFLLPSRVKKAAKRR